jgi:hypothetical protein
MTIKSLLSAGTLCLPVLPSALLIGAAPAKLQLTVPEDDMPQPPLSEGGI